MMRNRDSLSWIDDELEALEHEGLRRRLRCRIGAQAATIDIDGREMVNFGSNDYLALAGDERLAKAAAAACQLEGAGSGASPLVTGRGQLHARLEAALAEFEGTQAALLFPSGFAANAGTIPALVGDEDCVFADAKNHASLIDGCRLSRAQIRVYRHADCDQLAELLREGRHFRHRLIVTDSLFSMDGDLAPLPQLAELADEHDCMLMVDEAHATGVFGERGRGVAEHFGVEDRVEIKVGTLSKALGTAGGFVCGGASLIEWLANRARPYVFSTASPPALAAASLAAIRIVREEPHKRYDLLDRAAALCERLSATGWQVGRCASQIIPLVIGDPAQTMQISRELAQRGFFVPGIRPPSVPQGESLLRLSLSAGHSAEMVERLVAALAELLPATAEAPS